MATPDISQRTTRFDDFETDCLSGQLRHHGVRVRLPDQSFRMLLLLLDRTGQVVTREELRRELWAEDTFVDFEAGMNSAMKRLRDALGDSAETPRFIETLPRRGYRFRPAVKSVGADAVPWARRYGWQASLLALGVLAIGLFAVNAFGLRDRFMGPGPTSVALAVLPLKNLSGDASQDYYADGITEALI